MNPLPTNVEYPLEHSPGGAAPIVMTTAELPGLAQPPDTEPGKTPATGGGPWRPKSSREGIGPLRYVWWNSFYAIMEFLNRKLARDPNRKISWDKWAPYLGLQCL